MVLDIFPGNLGIKSNEKEKTKFVPSDLKDQTHSHQSPMPAIRK